MVLLDTNVVSELRKAPCGRADSRVLAWAMAVSPPDLFVSVITIEELEVGVLLAERRDAAKGAALRAWLDGQVLPSFAERILSVDLTVARCSAALHVPDPRPIRDALIAATALVHGMAVVTRNVSAFQRIGVSCVNPWADNP